MEYIVKTPEYIQANNNQLTDDQANRSRLVTKTRFVVEARNGNLKTIFRNFAKDWSTISAKHLREELRIAAAIINKYFNSVVADKGKEEVTANAMMTALPMPNIMKPIITQDAFQDEMRSFQQIDTDNFQFPQFAKEELHQFTLGTYQIKQAKSYANHHKRAKMDWNTEYLCYMCPTDTTQKFFADVIRDTNTSQPVLVFTRMASRFRSNKSHDSYILANASKNGPSAIFGYCCECQNGLRTVGCCSHVATSIFYLCYARHNGGIRSVAAHVDNFFDFDDSENDDD